MSRITLPFIVLTALVTTAVAAEPSEKVVLTGEHFWRKLYTYAPPKVSVASAKASDIPADPVERAKALARSYRVGLVSPPPRDGWADPGFDDSAWFAARGRQFVSASGGYSQMKYQPHNHNDPILRCTDPFVPEVSLVSQRGTFVVRDRAKVEALSLTITYRGGFVAYLNGTEVARGHLPAGKIAPDTPADDYGLDAFFVRDGQRAGQPLHWWEDRESRQWLVRERSAGPIAIKPELLRDGLNVLAVALHRSDYPAAMRKRIQTTHGPQLLFSPVGLSVLELKADGPPEAVEGLLPRRQGLQVWNADVSRAVGRDECALPGAVLKPIRIEAVRNGRFSGQVVVTGETTLANLAAAASALKRTDGPGEIPASAVSIRYGAVNPTQRGVGLDYLTAVVPPDAHFGKNYDDPASAMCGRFDLLLKAPPAEASSRPVWVTVQVPKDAPAGEYAGKLTIRAEGHEATETPVAVRVADWTLPDVAERVSLFNIYQSPDTLATYYKVKRWSEAHWRLIEKSLKLMGENGNIALIIPLLAESQMGNEESFIPWKRKAGTTAPAPTTAAAPPGTKNPVGDPATPIVSGEFEYDFTAFDRYLKTALKHHLRLRFLFVIAYGIEMGGPFGRAVYGGYVTVVEPDGRRVKMQLPRCGTPECEALWKPLLKAMRERAEELGFKGKCLLGMPCDYNPPGEHLLMFRRAAPEYGWMHESHMRIADFRYGKDPSEVIPVTYQSMVYTDAIPDPAERRFHGWQRSPMAKPDDWDPHESADRIVVGFNRFGFGPLCLLGFPPPDSFRRWFETNLASDRAGAGRVGGDYWNIGAEYKGGKLTSWAGGGMRGTLFGSYAHSQVGQVGMANNTHDLFAPGPDGPVTTVRLENACEGIQEAEARVFIERALLDKDHPLPEDLARRCRELLDLRTNVLRGMAIPGQAERNRLLFDLAGQVQRARRPVQP